MLLSNLKHLNQVVIKKKIFEFSLCTSMVKNFLGFVCPFKNISLLSSRSYSMVQTQDTLGRGHLDPEAFVLLNLIKDHWANVKHLMQVVLKENIFNSFAMYCYASNTQPSGIGPFWTPGSSFYQSLLRTTKQYFIPNFQHLSQVVLKNSLNSFLCISLV